MAILAKDQTSTNWIDGNNVAAEKIHTHLGTSYPIIVSQFKGYEEVIDESIDSYSLRQLLDIRSKGDLENRINFISREKFIPSNKVNLVWVNKVPYTVNNQSIVLLSPTHNRFSEFKSEIDSLFLRTEGVKIFRGKDLSHRLQELVKLTGTNTPVSVWGKS